MFVVGWGVNGLFFEERPLIVFEEWFGIQYKDVEFLSAF
jgi:hypothetical protein